MNGNWSQTAAPGLGEYYDDGRKAGPVSNESPVGVPYEVRGPFRLGALEAVAQNAQQPLPRLIGSGALLIGGILMALSELSSGPKGHHSAIGKYGRIAVGIGAAYWGFLYSAESLEMLRAAKAATP